MKKEFYKFYQTNKLYLFPAVVAISGLFLIIFVIYPQTAKLIADAGTVSGLSNKTSFLETKVTALESLDDVDLSGKVASVLDAYPGERDFANILYLLTQLAGNFGFSVTSISLNPSGAKLGGSDSYEVKMDIKGTRALLGDLISNIEGSYRLMRVNRVEVSQGGKASGSLDASLSVGILFSALPKTFGTVDSPVPELSEKDMDLLATISRMTKDVSASFPPAAAAPASPKGKINPFE